jgi:hypothetical protein
MREFAIAGKAASIAPITRLREGMRFATRKGLKIRSVLRPTKYPPPAESKLIQPSPWGQKARSASLSIDISASKGTPNMSAELNKKTNV